MRCSVCARVMANHGAQIHGAHWNPVDSSLERGGTSGARGTGVLAGGGNRRGVRGCSSGRGGVHRRWGTASGESSSCCCSRRSSGSGSRMQRDHRRSATLAVRVRCMRRCEQTRCAASAALALSPCSPAHPNALPMSGAVVSTVGVEGRGECDGRLVGCCAVLCDDGGRVERLCAAQRRQQTAGCRPAQQRGVGSGRSGRATRGVAESHTTSVTHA